jgi:hypothetical protein
VAETGEVTCRGDATVAPGAIDSEEEKTAVQPEEMDAAVLKSEAVQAPP